MDTMDSTLNHTMTVVLSRMGWVRVATGINIDPYAMFYRSSDRYLSHAIGKSNQYAVFISNLGRSFSVLIKDLPSARGQGEPISTKISLWWLGNSAVSKAEKRHVVSDLGSGL